MTKYKVVTNHLAVIIKKYGLKQNHYYFFSTESNSGLTNYSSSLLQNNGTTISASNKTRETIWLEDPYQDKREKDKGEYSLTDVSFIWAKFLS